jgi:hypothetical protein
MPSDREIGAANVVILGTRHYIGPSGYPGDRRDDAAAASVR